MASKLSMIIDTTIKGADKIDSYANKILNVAKAQEKLNKARASSKSNIKNSDLALGDSIVKENELKTSHFKSIGDLYDIGYNKDGKTISLTDKGKAITDYNQLTQSISDLDSKMKKLEEEKTRLEKIINGGGNVTKEAKAYGTLTKRLELAKQKYEELSEAKGKIDKEIANDPKIKQEQKAQSDLEKASEKSYGNILKIDEMLGNLKSERLGNVFLGIGKGILNETKKVLSRYRETYKKLQSSLKNIKKKFTDTFSSIFHVFKYMVLRMSFRALIKDWGTFFDLMVQYSEEFKNNINDMYTALMRINATVVAAVKPIIQVLAPAIQYLTSAIRRLLDIVSQFNAALFLNSKTYTKVNDFVANYSDLIDDAAGNTSKLSKQLASFDTINKLGSDSNSGSSPKTLEDMLADQQIYSEAPIEDKIQQIIDELNMGKGSTLGTLMAEKFNDLVNEGLKVFSKENFEKNLEPKLKGINDALHTFFDKINSGYGGDNGTAFNFGTLASSIINTITNSIITLLKDDGKGQNLGGKIGTAIGNFLQGAIDGIQFDKLGELMASITNFVGKFWAAIWGKMQETVGYGNNSSMIGPAEIDGSEIFSLDAAKFKPTYDTRTYAQKLADSITEMFKIAAEETDFEAIAQSFIDKANTIMDIMIGVMDGKGTYNFKKGMAVGAVLKQNLLQLAGKVIKVFGMAISEAIAGFAGGFVGFFLDSITVKTENLGEIKLPNNLLGQLYAIVTRMIDVIAGYIKNSWTTIKNAIVDLFTFSTQEVNKDESVKQKFASIGTYCLEGLKEGLSNKLSLEGIKARIKGIVDEIKYIFTGKGDEDSGGMEIGSPSKVFESFGQYIIQGLNNGLNNTQLTDGLLTKIQSLKDNVIGIKDTLVSEFGTVKDSLTAIFEGITEAFKGEMFTMVTMLNTTMSTVESGLNSMVSALNRVIRDYNRAAAAVGEPTISTVSNAHIGQVAYPKLAQGAVIPPNKEFLAVLGDQKSGTNIETPLQTMIDAFNTALQNNGYGKQSQVILEVDGRTFGKACVDLSNKESRRVGARMVY